MGGWELTGGFGWSCLSCGALLRYTGGLATWVSEVATAATNRVDQDVVDVLTVAHTALLFEGGCRGE